MELLTGWKGVFGEPAVKYTTHMSSFRKGRASRHIRVTQPGATAPSLANHIWNSDDHPRPTSPVAVARVRNYTPDREFSPPP